MATVRHSTARIDFNPADVTSKVTITVSDSDGVPLESIAVKMTHIMAAVSKMSMVMVRRDVAIARIIGEMDDEINVGAQSQVETSEMQHARVCVIVGSHTTEQCVAPSLSRSFND